MAEQPQLKNVYAIRTTKTGAYRARSPHSVSSLTEPKLYSRPGAAMNSLMPGEELVRFELIEVPCNEPLLA